MNLNTQNAGEYSVVGVFDDYSHAQSAIRDLKEAGVPAHRIGIGIGQTGVASEGSDDTQREGFWRKIAGFFEGKDHAAADADYEVSEAATSGPKRVVVSVSASTREGREELEEILEQHHAQIESSDANQTEETLQQPGRDRSVEGGQRIQLLSEILQVHKDRVSKGEVRLRKEVVSENQTIEVPVTREELVIERVPAEASTTPSAQIGSDREVRIPLTEEQVRVEKKPTVKEEIRVGKKKVQESKQVTEQLKREELHVDREGDVQPDRKKGVA